MATEPKARDREGDRQQHGSEPVRSILSQAQSRRLAIAHLIDWQRLATRWLPRHENPGPHPIMTSDSTDQRYEELGKSLCLRAGKEIACGESARDAVQEALAAVVKLDRDRGHLCSDAQLRRVAFAILKNKIADHHRRSRRRRERELDPAHVAAPPPPADCGADRSRIAKIATWLNGIHPAGMTIATQHVDGMSQRDIAQRLGISASAVKKVIKEIELRGAHHD
ncbi:MAG: sigma-70 family RNA polymerase sigma factor [Planctomycetota bacterium]